MKADRDVAFLHDYGRVDVHRVWDVVEDRLPSLLESLRKIQKRRGQ